MITLTLKLGLTETLTLEVMYVGNYPRWCIGIGIGIGIGRGKSLTCITAVESTTSPIVKT